MKSLNQRLRVRRVGISLMLAQVYDGSIRTCSGRCDAWPNRNPCICRGFPDTLTMGELERLLAQPVLDELWERHFPGKPERDRLLLALTAYAGLRRSELLGLDWDDVDLSRRLLRIGK